MSTTAALLLGAAAGFLLARALINPSDCCTTVQNLVRTKIANTYGSGAADLADALGLTDLAPGLLSVTGYSG